MTCAKLVLVPGHFVRAFCRGPQIAYTLGAPQGNVAVVLATGDPLQQAKNCASFGPATGATVFRDGSAGGFFRALNAGATGVCP